ncbi:TRAP transporter small permease subunit [Vreelandella titanicae]|jgi:TRAP-type mannitol/chloroaromatic compound transport system permease small subunit|uniref:TRAP transporter small permease protein n=1 Tax=Vreelandella titanicae TaxID=664683 RepID=A0A558JF47_9GAMM|nr:TRAP transporter small permease subunit [Halomonas titanicae]TVU92250.1 TRAP transporter small permease subunit [Halomonas titanicae]|tara:strand:+ start:21751 stop:22398 length:648 start_codon:yes stop_codon:yes gene_type:complete
MSNHSLSWNEKGAMICNALARPLVGLGMLLGRISSWLVLLIIVSVLISVFLNFIRINEVVNWEQDIPLFGRAITISSMIDLQWHLFGVLTMLSGAYALHCDTHVRVDLIYQKLSPRGRAVIDILGHVCLLLPFCLLTAWFSKSFVMMSFVSGEGSGFGGLIDRYLIKSIIPIGMLLLAIAAVGEVLKKMAILLAPPFIGNDVERSHISGGDYDAS